MSSTTEQPNEPSSLVQKIERIIPGLGSKAPAPKPSKSRSRGKGAAKNASTTSAIQSMPEPVDAVEEKPEVGHHKFNGPSLALDSLVVPETPLQPLKRTSATVTVQKRIKNAQKKIVRIQAYKDQKEALNADQQAAVASLAGLESLVKELADIAKVLEAEEADFEKQSAARANEDEKRMHARIASAGKEARRHMQAELTTFLQFLHLNSLFSQTGQGINGASALPAVVSAATGQEAAAVRMLAEEIINGPLLGGGDDAFERIDKLQKGEQSDIVEGVSYARVKQMILDLTANPAEIGEHELPAEASVPGGLGFHEQPSLTQEQAEAAVEAHSYLANAPLLTFMQASELHVPDHPAVDAVQQGYQPLSQKEDEPAPSSHSTSQAQPLMDITNTIVQEDNLPVDPLSQNGAGQPQINSWADEVDQVVPAAQPVSHSNERHQGGHRGSFRGRGRGGPREYTHDRSGSYENRPPRDGQPQDAENRPPPRQMRGGFRGAPRGQRGGERGDRPDRGHAHRASQAGDWRAGNRGQSRKTDGQATPTTPTA